MKRFEADPGSALALTRTCARCGAEPGKPCTTVTDAKTVSGWGKRRGDVREFPHIVRIPRERLP